MPAENPSLWSVLLPVIVGALLASVVPIVLALIHRRWTQQDEHRREESRLADARRAERKLAVQEYLRARTEYGTCAMDLYGARLAGGTPSGRGSPAGEAMSAAGKRVSLAIVDLYLLWTGEELSEVVDDAMALEKWAEILQRTEKPYGTWDAMPPAPPVPKGIDRLLASQQGRAIQ